MHKIFIVHAICCTISNLIMISLVYKRLFPPLFSRNCVFKLISMSNAWKPFLRNFRNFIPITYSSRQSYSVHWQQNSCDTSDQNHHKNPFILLKYVSFYFWGFLLIIFFDLFYILNANNDFFYGVSVFFIIWY